MAAVVLEKCFSDESRRKRSGKGKDIEPQRTQRKHFHRKDAKSAKVVKVLWIA
jgi:hypothetical protein